VFDRSNKGETLRCTFNLSATRAAFQPSGRPLIRTGDIDGEAFGPYAALIEEIA
jgi:hypothetical protein